MFKYIKNLLKNNVIKNNQPYPKWKENLNTDPSEEEFLISWQNVFDHPYDECEVNSDYLHDGILSVGTPTTHYTHGGFGFDNMTDNPIVEKYEDLFYTGAGTTWAIDLNGNRYQLLSKFDMLPYQYDDLKDCSNIYYYLLNEQYRNREKILDTLLDEND